MKNNKKLVVAFTAYMSLYQYMRNNYRKMRKRRWYARPLNAERASQNYFKNYFCKMKSMDPEQFVLHTRMTRNLYDMLLASIKVHIIKPKQMINADERLSITLLFLAQGVSMQSIAWKYKIGKSTARIIILETCEAIWSALSPLYLSVPTEYQYMDIANDFANMWNFPNCVGAIDGKHVAVTCPAKSGTMCYNYKNYFSIVLMGMCDAKYAFTAVSIGSYGSESDGGIFRISPFGHAVLNDTLRLPPDAPLPNSSSQEAMPYVFVADAAFPLCKRIMKPISPRRCGQLLCLEEKIFNYRLSRARRTIENAFGILTARWRILHRKLEFMPTNSEKVVLACVALHNFILMNDYARNCPSTFVDSYSPEGTRIPGEWRKELENNGGPLRSIISHARRSSSSFLQQRNKLVNYFLTEGAVAFQPKN